MASKSYSWTEISSTPDKPGVYAWYYSPEITHFDLQTAIDRIKIFSRDNDTESALKFVNEFLQSYLFRYFQEDPYHAIVFGSLKPKYEGYIEHKPELSEELVKRIVEEPERLITIKQVLEKSAPDFASPIYIGMSENLNQRLKHHKRLIEKYCSQSTESNNSSKITTKNSGERERNFAMRICSRNIQPTRLFVVINILENVGSQYIDIENILNRIHYPLLGRN